MKTKYKWLLGAVLFIGGMVVLFAHFIGIPPHFLQADKYETERVQEYVAKCYPLFAMIGREQKISNDDMEAYWILKKQFGGEEGQLKLYSMLDGRFRQEYYATIYKDLPIPELECQDDIAILALSVRSN